VGRVERLLDAGNHDGGIRPMRELDEHAVEHVGVP
jgi:hypothetical protein